MPGRETAKLLNYGYRYFEGVNLYDAGQELGQDVRVWGGEMDSLAIGPAETIYQCCPRCPRSSRTHLEMDKRS